tara:strand:+ start:296 stop:1966 length:1671 start_codon:yes stop_codon:yes gene_type:complete
LPQPIASDVEKVENRLKSFLDCRLENAGRTKIMADTYIQKIHLKNFRGFKNKKIDGLSKGLNILIGDNDSGKSTVLLAIDLVLSGNTNRVEAIGLDRLLNQNVVDEFLNGSIKKYEDLPELELDIYLKEFGRHEFVGEHNLEQLNACGIYLRCQPRTDLRDEIEALLKKPNIAFPFEYYSVTIKTFSGSTVSPYKRPVQHLSIDNTRISNEYASKAYVKSIYQANSSRDEQNELKFEYRTAKSNFSKERFVDINRRMDSDYRFALKNNTSSNLETDLTISQNGIEIENAGVGTQCFIRTRFALSKKSNIDVVLLEEPENHLSHSRMRKLIEEIKGASQSQLFIATHSSLVCSRLGLGAAILLGAQDEDPIKLSSLSQDTADFFMKAPNSAVLEFVLSKTNILVEGDAEFILMPTFFEKVKGCKLDEVKVNVISIGGLSFPRYLEIAKLLNIKTAVITDNDGDKKTCCEDRYSQFGPVDNIEVFFDGDDARSTFEICVYQDNTAQCDKLFAEGRRSLTVQDYMLKNKSQAAFVLASKASDEIVAPSYIAEAIKWVTS